MRIDGWHADGFGILKDFDQADLEPGVTVLLGENEAGKSTLLAFVRAMLFGFPDGRSKERSYPPLLGGRHGGKLLLRDRSAGLWVVQRYADDRKTLGLLRPDGSEGDAAELTALLGGADAHLFKSVFAFGLDELQLLESLTGEGVRDRIFSAGISGAGRSAREVMRRLEQRQEALLKQRGGKARINDIVRELNQVDEDEKAARALVGRYEQLLRDERQQNDLAAELQSESDRLQRRKTEVEAFIELRPQWDEREEARLELADLPQLTDPSLPDQVAGLVKELEGQRAREERLPELEATRAEESAAVEAALSRLGDGWDIERAKRFDTSVAVEDEVRGWEKKITEGQGTFHEAQQKRLAADADVALQQAQIERRRTELPDAEPLTIEEIDRREALLRGLREDVGRCEMLRLRAEQEAPQTVASRARLVFVLASLAALGAAGSWIAGYPQLGVGLVVAAALLALAGALTWSRRPEKAAGPARRPNVIEGLLSSMGKTAASLGLPTQPSTAAMAEREASLKTERTRRAEWNSAQHRIRDAEDQAEEARRLAGEAAKSEKEAQRVCSEVAQGWAAWLAQLGLRELSPTGVLDVLKQAESGRSAAGRLHAAVDAIDAIAKQARGCEESAKRRLEAAGRPSAGLLAEALRTAVETLDGDLERRASLSERVGSLERAVSVRLGSCEDPEGAMDELASGDAGVWEGEARRLSEELAQRRDERDAAIKAATTARGELQGIEESADIPRLQEQRESLRAELANLVHEYRVVSTANALIADTLKTYVRERQPAVLASGSKAFSTVTNGRYVRVQQDDAGGLESVVVVNRDGQQLKPDMLSKGAQQQLYLSIRLALVAEFATRTEPLPLIMDDCLVNFDPKRAAAVAGLLAERSADGQCLLFTCHPETAELVAGQTAGPVKVIEMAAG